MLDTTTGRLTRFSDLGVLGSWTHDGGQYVGIAEQRIEVWSPGGDLIRDSSDHPLPGTPIDVGLNGDDSRVIVAFRSGRVRTYDALTWEPVGTPLDVGEPVCCFSGLPDGHTAFALVGGAPNPKLDSFEYLYPPNSWALLDLDTGTIVKRHEFPFLHGGLGSALSPDGTRVAVGSADGEVAIIDLESGRPIRPLEVTHTRECCQLAWSPDGSSVVASSNDGTVSLWNGHSGELLGLVRIPEAIPSSVEFRDDGLTVSIVGYTDSVYLWDTSTETPLEYACTLAGRNFTQEEWQTYFDDRPYIRTCPD
jgi:WD40 repeat protein